MLEQIKAWVLRASKWLIGPSLKFAYGFALQFLKWWRDAPTTVKLASFPVLIIALVVYGAYRFLNGGCE